MPKNTESLIGLLISILVIIIAVANGIAIGYALIVVWCIMAYVFYRKGYQPKRTAKPILDRCEKLDCGDANILAHRLAHCYVASSRHHPMIIATGIDLIDPSFFIVCAFLLTAIVSMVLGTSFGTVGTIGIVLITMARAGNIPEDIVAGAILAGAYFGDRNGPLSSSASLVAALTHTRVPTNIPIMF